MRLEWSVLAMADREAIFDYIEAESPRVAIAIDERISAQSQTLIQFPHSGRPGRIEGTRELVIGQTPFVVAYRVTDDLVRILRVLHGAQEWPEDFQR
uniref:Addiction module toxin, RelE/StbE family n=1 Tax=Caulobacter sp. (strain K31) TaxID=366602 RepID=B0T7Z6_CAUSK